MISKNFSERSLEHELSDEIQVNFSLNSKDQIEIYF